MKKTIDFLLEEGLNVDFASKLEVNSLKAYYNIGIVGGKEVGKKTLYRILTSGLFT